LAGPSGNCAKIAPANRPRPAGDDRLRPGNTYSRCGRTLPPSFRQESLSHMCNAAERSFLEVAGIIHLKPSGMGFLIWPITIPRSTAVDQDVDVERRHAASLWVWRDGWGSAGPALSSAAAIGAPVRLHRAMSTGRHPFLPSPLIDQHRGPENHNDRGNRPRHPAGAWIQKALGLRPRGWWHAATPVGLRSMSAVGTS